MPKSHVDVLIIGRGLTGMALMSALENTGFSTLLVDASVQAPSVSADFDARTLALSPASIRILNHLALWPLLAPLACPIDTIQVSEQHRLGLTSLSRTTDGALGFVIEIQHLNRALQQNLDRKKLLAPVQLIALNKHTNLVTIKNQAKEQQLHATLIVAADGMHSAVRHLLGLKATIKDYHQQAIVANIGLNREHDNWAYERFTKSGSLALLPMISKRASLVWSVNNQAAAAIMAMDARTFLTTLQQSFGYRAGRFNQVGARFAYPLHQLIMTESIAWPVVFIGNAAHTLHPVAGQGFNLGLRDVAMLAQCLTQYGLNADMLTHYQANRRYDQFFTSQFTEQLLRAFSSRLPGIGGLRSLGLMTIDSMPLIKKILIHHSSGFTGLASDLICGIDSMAGGRYDPII